MQSSKFNKLGSVLLLSGYALVTIATSYAKDYVPIVKNYTINSNCSNATYTVGPITTSDATIINPASTTYLNLGLPVALVFINTDTLVTGDIAPALSRSCIRSSGVVSGYTITTYTCADNSIPSCIVNFTHLD